MIPSLGRIIHVRLNDDAYGSERWRPATITAAWSETCVNAVITLDGQNDNDLDTRRLSIPSRDSFHAWITSSTEGTEPGNWRWPPRT